MLLAAGVALGAAVGLCAAFYAWLRREAARVQVGDTGRLLKVGNIAKLAHLFGIPCPRLSAQTFVFHRARDITAPGDADSEGGELGIHALLNTPRERRGEVLVVAFSGGAARGPGMPRPEFRRTIARAAPTADQLYVLDPTGMSFFEHNIENVTESLALAVQGYDRVVFVGNCMGGTGALRFCHLLRSSEDSVVAFNPEVSPATDARRAFRIAAWLSPRACKALPGVLDRAIAATAARVRVHVSSWEPELSQGRLLFMPETAVADSTSGRWPEPVAPAAREHPTLRVVHSSCTEHDMVPKVLRPAGTLAAIVGHAVMCCDDRSGEH